MEAICGSDGSVYLYPYISTTALFGTSNGKSHARYECRAESRWERSWADHDLNADAWVAKFCKLKGGELSVRVIVESACGVAVEISKHLMKLVDTAVDFERPSESIC